jgi:peptide/nickel transport system permease protein
MTVEVLEAPVVHHARRSELAYLFATAARSRRGAFGLGLTLLVVVIAALGPFVAPHSPTEFVTSPFAPPSHGVLLGGDSLGRDVLSRVLAGGWQLLLVAAMATALGVIVGAVAGVAAAYLAGWRDSAIMRVADVILAFPQVVFALLMVSVVGPNVALLVLAVGFSHAPQVARVIRATALDVSERDFVKAVQITGVKATKVMRLEILPNLLSPLMVEIGLRMAYSVVIIAGLSFIGFGLQPPSPNWGSMINENRIGVTLNAWGTTVPCLLLAILCVGLNTFTDAVARAALGTDRADRLLLTEALGEPERVVAA